MDYNNIIDNIRNINKDKIKEYILFEDNKQQDLFKIARNIRNNSIFSNKVELRSVIELSNICTQKCNYCSMGKNGEKKYILSKEETIESIKYLANTGRRTFLLQSGEYNNQKFIDDLSICCESALKLYPDIRLILCCGNMKRTQYQQLFNAGATRYILKFETANSNHHKFCRPTDSIEKRLSCIYDLIDLGYKVGSGNIVGLPHQTIDNLIEDLELINKLDLSMVSATKFIPNENSKFKNFPVGNINITLNFLAILRILKPNCLIPATSSLETGNANGQTNGLLAGCNTLTVHDGTPKDFEKAYSIYSQNRFMPAEKYCINIIEQVNMIPKNYLI